MAFFSKLKQIRDLRTQAKKLQDILGSERITTESRDRRIKVTLDGNQQIQELFIDPGLFGNPAALTGALRETLNQSIREAQKIIARKMRDLEERGEFKMPDLKSLGS